MRMCAFGLAIVFTALPAWAASGQDGITVQVSKVPPTTNISLQWGGGLTPYSIFRSTSAVDVTTPLSYLGTSSGSSYVDVSPPAGGIFFYYVQGECDYNPPEICDGLDNDCDTATADGSQDPQIGAACDGTDGDSCLEGTTSCFAASLACSDATGTTVEQCLGNGGDENCDGTVDEGFPINTNPSCDSYELMGSLWGDLGPANSLSTAGNSERWLRVNLVEADTAGEVPLTLSVSLYSPAGSDYDLFIRCDACNGNTFGFSSVRGMSGHLDRANIKKLDNTSRSDTFGVLIEVRSFASSYCGTWQLVVQGNTGAAAIINCPSQE